MAYQGCINVKGGVLRSYDPSTLTYFVGLINLTYYGVLAPGASKGRTFNIALKHVSA